jgi:hypothetical protein
VRLLITVPSHWIICRSSLNISKFSHDIRHLVANFASPAHDAFEARQSLTNSFTQQFRAGAARPRPAFFAEASPGVVSARVREWCQSWASRLLRRLRLTRSGLTRRCDLRRRLSSLLQMVA